MTVLSFLIACSTPADIDLTGPPHARPSRTPARCVTMTVDSVHPRGVSSPSITDTNTRLFGRTADGRTVAWDYSRALWPGPPLAQGDTLFLLVTEEGAPVGIDRTCPVDLPAEATPP